jgi:hypothetical protein
MTTNTGTSLQPWHVALAEWLAEHPHATARYTLGGRGHVGHLSQQPSNGRYWNVRDSSRAPRSQYALVTRVEKLELRAAGEHRFRSALDVLMGSQP